jgi:hypothetical protein
VLSADRSRWIGCRPVWASEPALQEPLDEGTAFLRMRENALQRFADDRG